MNDIALTVISGLSVLVMLLIGLSFVKAEKHVDYLRLTNPDEYSAYKRYSDSFSFNHYSIYVQATILPFFERKRELEDEKLRGLAVNIQRLVQYQWGLVILLASFITYVVISA
jgi:hypothetical protein